MNESVEVLKKKAHDLVQKGKLDSALRAFTLILESDPRDASVHNKVGDILLKTHSEAAALEHFLKSAELYYEEGLHMVALSVCRKILRASETIPRAYYLMGKCLQAQDKGDQAKREYVRYLSTEADGNDDSKAEVLRALTILDPAEDKWVLLLAKVCYRRKNEAFLDYAVGLALERDLPQHEKMHQMLTALRKSQIKSSLELVVTSRTGKVSAQGGKPAPPATPARVPSGGKTGPGERPVSPTSGAPGTASSRVAAQGPAPSSEAAEKPAARRIGPVEKPRAVPATIQEPEAEELSEAEIRKKLEGASVRRETATPGKSEGKPSRPPAKKPEPEPESEESLLESLDFSEADLGSREQLEQEMKAVDEIIGVNPDSDRETPFEKTIIEGPRRIGEYFVASGLLKAGDVLRALEKQSAEMKESRLGDVLVSMGLVSAHQVREALSRQVADIRASLARNPQDALGHVEMANLLLDVGDFYGAVSAYLQAAEIYRSEDRDYMVFELLEGVLDICPESLSAAKELIRIRHTIGSSGQARAFYRLAVAYLLNGSNYEAMAALQTALEVDPGFHDARNLMTGICPDYKDHKNLADMAEILDDIERVKTDSSKGFLAGMIREFQEGVNAYIPAEDHKTHFDLGIAYMEMGLFREAVSEFEKVLASPDYRLRAREMLGRCAFSMQRYDEAEDHFRKGMALAGGDSRSMVGFHVNLAKVYAYTGRDSHATAEMEAAAALDPVLSKALSLE